MGGENEVILGQQINNQYCLQSVTAWPSKGNKSRSTLHQGKTW